MTATQVLKAHGLSTQDEADELLVKLANDRAALLTALKEVQRIIDESDEWWMEGRFLMAQIDAAIAQAEASCR